MIEAKKTVEIIIPAYNEGDKIGITIASIQHYSWIDRILVIDDGSTDNTAETALNAGADVISLPINKGKAYAMKTGYQNSSSDILIFLDGDIDEGAEQIKRLVEPLWDGTAEAVIARFPMTPGKGGFGFVKGLAQKGLYILTGQSLSSVLSGQRAFLRNVLLSEFFDYNGYGIEFGMTVDLLSRDIKIQEVDVVMRHRTTGKDIIGYKHRFRQFCNIFNVFIQKLIKKPFQNRHRVISEEQDKI